MGYELGVCGAAVFNIPLRWIGRNMGVEMEMYVLARQESYVTL